MGGIWEGSWVVRGGIQFKKGDVVKLDQTHFVWNFKALKTLKRSLCKRAHLIAAAREPRLGKFQVWLAVFQMGDKLEKCAGAPNTILGSSIWEQARWRWNNKSDKNYAGTNSWFCSVCTVCMWNVLACMYSLYMKCFLGVMISNVLTASRACLGLKVHPDRILPVPCECPCPLGGLWWPSHALASHVSHSPCSLSTQACQLPQYRLCHAKKK